MSKRYNLIDAMRIIAAFFIVTIHVSFPGDVGIVMNTLARFAVPFFFMTSGFFSYYQNDSIISGKIKSKIKHTAILAFAAWGFCIAYEFITRFYKYLFFEGSAPYSYLYNTFSLKSILKLLTINVVTEFTHFWFLFALLYVYIIFAILHKLHIQDKVAFLIPILLALGIALKEFTVFNKNLPSVMYESGFCRNFLFVGLPLFLLGYYIRKNETKLTQKYTYVLLVILMVVGSAEAIAVRFLHALKDIYIGTIIAALALFILLLKLEGKVSVPHLSSLGRKYSLYVYIFHKKLIMELVDLIISHFGLTWSAINWLKPFIVFLLALALSAVYCKLKEFIVKIDIDEKQFRKEKNRVKLDISNSDMGKQESG